MESAHKSGMMDSHISPNRSHFMGKILNEKKKSYKVNFGVINPETQHPFFCESKVLIRLFLLILMDFRITFSSFYHLIFTSQDWCSNIQGEFFKRFPELKRGQPVHTWLPFSPLCPTTNPRCAKHRGMGKETLILLTFDQFYPFSVLPKFHGRHLPS